MREIGGGDGETRMLLLIFGPRYGTWRIWVLIHKIRYQIVSSQFVS